MKNFADYLGEMKAKYKVATDAQAAKMLDLDPKKIGEMVAGTRAVPDAALWKLADLIGVDPSEIKAGYEYGRAKKETDRELWKGVFFRHCRAAAIGVIALCASAGMIEPAHAGGDVNVIAHYANLRLGKKGRHIACRPHSPAP